MGIIIDLLLDTIEDVLKIVPFLLAVYFFLEWMEQEHEHKLENLLETHRKLAPAAGALLALFPSCGFSGASSSLYATGVISLGTLMAVYLSTSDEMLPIMVTAGAAWHTILPVLLVKLVAAFVFGYIIDRLVPKKKIDINEFCEREHDDHSHGLFHSVLLHTLEVSAWLMVITFLFNGAVKLVGEETLRAFISSYPNKSVLLCGIVGMIPNCASSVLLTTMYLEGVISFPAVCTGLLANAGTGIMILWRVNPGWKENIKIMLLLWGCSLLSGAVMLLLNI